MAIQGESLKPPLLRIILLRFEMFPNSIKVRPDIKLNYLFSTSTVSMPSTLPSQPNSSS